MLRRWLAATTVVAMMTDVAVAQTANTVEAAPQQSPSVVEPLATSNGSPSATAYLGSMSTSTGPGAASQTLPLYTGYSGPMATSAFPNFGGQGQLMYNGNGTSMIVPGQPPAAMSTPER